MTINKLKNPHKKTIDGVEFHTVSVLDYKTGKTHGPVRITFRNPDIYQVALKYISKPTDEDAKNRVFLNSNGRTIRAACFINMYNRFVRRCKFPFLESK